MIRAHMEAQQKMAEWTAGQAQLLERRATRTTALSEYYDRLAENARAFFNIPAGSRLLDVGCGTGWMRRLYADCEYCGVDPVPAPGVLAGEAEALPFETKSFDAGICYSVLQHTLNPDLAVLELARVVRPGGRVGFLVCLDENPHFVRKFTRETALRLIGSAFLIRGHQVVDGSFLLVAAERPPVQRIAYLTYCYPAWTETFTRRILRALAARGHTLQVYTHGEAPGPPTAGVPGIPYQHGGTARDLVPFRPDVLVGCLSIHSHKKAYGFATVLERPFVLRIWSGFDVFSYPSPEFYAKASRSLWCRACVVEDEFMADYAVRVMQVMPERIRIMPNSLYPDEYVGVRRPVDGVLLGIGRFIPKKGFIYAVRAMRDLPDMRLMLIGEGPERSAYELEAALSRARVLLPGTVPETTLPTLYHEAEMLIAPCIQVAHNHDADGIPTVVLEAMASACPVIASDLLSAGHYIANGKTGLLVKPGCPRAISEAVRMLRDQPALAEELGRAARIFAQRRLNINTNIGILERAFFA